MYADILNARPVRMRGHVVTNPANSSHPSLLKAFVIDDMKKLIMRGQATASRVTDDGVETIMVTIPDTSGDMWE